MSAESSAHYIAKLAEKDRADSPWIAVADQEPPFDVTILVTDGQYPFFARYERGALGYPRKFVERGGWQLPGVTHWMPLPPLPRVYVQPLLTWVAA